MVLLDDRTSDAQNQLQSIAHGVLVMERLSRDLWIRAAPAQGRQATRLPLPGRIPRLQHRDRRHRIVSPLIAAEHLTGAADGGSVSSGIEQLDRLTGGGLDYGSSTLVIGPAGVGKSSVAMRYAVEVARSGQHAAFYTFDETVRTLANRTANLGSDPRPHIESGLLHIQQIDPAEISPGGFIHLVRADALERRARVIVIDSLNGLLNAMPDEDCLTIRMHELLTFLNHSGVVVLLVLSQAGILGPTMHSPVDLSYLADNMLLLRYFEAVGKVRKAISVVKKRSSGHEDTIRELHLQPGGIVVGEPLADFQGVITGVPQFVGVAESTGSG